MSVNVLHIDHQSEIVSAFFWQEMMMKFAIAQKMSSVQGILPASVKNGITMLNDSKDKFAIGSIKEMAKSVPENISQLGSSKTIPAYKKLSKGLSSEGPYPVLNGEDEKVPNDIPQQKVSVLDAKGFR